jgi:succinate dehydrogenase / fumarate reductase cytochrome b subunit
MRRVIDLYRSSVGKKIVMAATGAFLLLFVVGHLAGNLKLYFGQEKFDHYAHWLREMGAPLLLPEQGLWIFRILLLVAVALHLFSAAQLTLASWRARGQAYRKQEHIAFSYASYTMRWGGLVVALYVIYHLLDLTWGTVHHNFTSSPYVNVVSGFQIWWVSAIYIAAVIPLGLHIYHGIWSALQTLGVNNPQYNTWRRPVAAAVAGLIVLGYISIPVSVLLGLIKLNEG